MADYTIAATDRGAYELPLAAGVESTVTVQAPANQAGWPPILRVMQHGGTNPVYAKAASTVTAQDPAATLVAPGGFTRMPPSGYPFTVHLICAAAAVVSVAKQ